jgi:hypothetical protein
MALRRHRILQRAVQRQPVVWTAGKKACVGAAGCPANASLAEDSNCARGILKNSASNLIDRRRPGHLRLWQRYNPICWQEEAMRFRPLHARVVEGIARTAGRGLTIPALAMTNTPLVVVLSNDGCEIERATAQNGKCAVKAALLMLAKRDALRAGDTLRVEADAVVAEVPKKKTGAGYGARDRSRRYRRLENAQGEEASRMAG